VSRDLVPNGPSKMTSTSTGARPGKGRSGNSRLGFPFCISLVSVEVGLWDGVGEPSGRARCGRQPAESCSSRSGSLFARHSLAHLGNNEM
jgi:hypothetical protein